MVLTERDRLIIREISRWRGIVGRQVKVLCDFEGQRACDRRLKLLIDNGYLERKRYIYGVAGVFSVTNKANKQLNIDLPVGVVRLDQLEHNISVVDAAIYFIKSLGIIQSAIATEKELQHIRGFGNRVHLPDFVYMADGKKYCVEVELSQKAKARLEKNIKQNYIDYYCQYWIIPNDKQKIWEMVLDNAKKYSNIEIINMGVVDEFIRQYK